MVKMPVGLQYNLVEPFARFLIPGFLEHLENPVLNSIIAAFLILVQALWLNHIVNQFNLVGKPTFLPALVYVTLSGLFAPFLVLSQPLICCFAIILLVSKLLSLYKSGQAINATYDLGLIVGLGTLVYFPFIYMVLAAWVGLIIFRPFNWREWVVVFVGFATIYFFVAVYYYLNDGFNDFLKIWLPLTNTLPGQIQINYYNYLVLIPVIIISLSAFTAIRKNFFKSYVQVRKSFQLLLFIGVLASVSFYIKATFSVDHFMLCIAPSTVIFAYYFASAKNVWYYETLYLLLLTSMVYFQFNTF